MARAVRAGPDASGGGNFTSVEGTPAVGAPMTVFEMTRDSGGFSKETSSYSMTTSSSGMTRGFRPSAAAARTRSRGIHSCAMPPGLIWPNAASMSAGIDESENTAAPRTKGPQRQREYNDSEAQTGPHAYKRHHGAWRILHRPRAVQRARLLPSVRPMPAIIYDALPSVASARPAHDAVFDLIRGGYQAGSSPAHVGRRVSTPYGRRFASRLTLAPSACLSGGATTCRRHRSLHWRFRHEADF